MGPQVRGFGPFVYMEVSMKRCITMLLRLLIRFYQLAISPLKPGLLPLLSDMFHIYSLQAIEKYGPLKGSWMGFETHSSLSSFPQGWLRSSSLTHVGLGWIAFCESNFHHHHRAQFWKYH